MFELSLVWDRPARVARDSNRSEHHLCVRLRPTGAGPRRPLHLAVALDTSSSMSGEKLRAALHAAREIVSLLGPEDTLSLAGFGSSLVAISEAQPLGPANGPTRATLLQRLAALQALGTTRTDLALQWIAGQLGRTPTGQARAAVLITDGHATDAQGAPLKDDGPLVEAARRIAAMEATLSATGYGSAKDFNTGLLTRLAEAGRSAFLYAATPAELAPELRDLVSRAQATTATWATVRVRPVLARLEVEAACQITPDYLPTDRGAPDADGRFQWRLQNLPGKGVTPGGGGADFLLRVRAPGASGFAAATGERSALEVEVEVEGQRQRLSAVASLNHVASMQDAQQLDREVDRLRARWEVAAGYEAVQSSPSVMGTVQLLEAMSRSARAAGLGGLVVQVEGDLNETRQKGGLSAESLTRSIRNARDPRRGG